MRSEWFTSELGDIVNFIDYRGKTPPKKSSGIPLITAKIIKDNMIKKPQEFIAYDYYDTWMKRGIPKKGEVIFTTEAPLGEVAQIFYALQHNEIKHRIEARSTILLFLELKVQS